MRISVARAAPMLAIGMLLGCSGGTPAAAPAAGAPVARQPPRVRCGEAPVVGRTLRSAQIEQISLPGAPDGVASTPDGRLAFVALQSGPPRIAVIANTRFGARLLRTVAVPASVSGLKVTPDGRFVLGATGRGAVMLSARGKLLSSLAAPAGVAGAGPGAAEVAVSPDSRYAFVTLEGAGVVAVFDLADPQGYIGSIPVGSGALGITVSPDGRWLYEVSESAHGRGALNVIDVRRAVHAPHSAVVARAAAPCAPVRIAVSPDGNVVWVTARAGNALLGFSAAALRRDPAHALTSVTRVGEQPLGLAVVDGGSRVLVADSNLSNARHAHSGVSVVDATASARPSLLGSIPAGKLADAISAPPTSGLALMTESGSRQLEALSLRRLP
jgi:DNA-binding beta-propeller fold protein YncE